MRRILALLAVLVSLGAATTGCDWEKECARWLWECAVNYDAPGGGYGAR